MLQRRRATQRSTRHVRALLWVLQPPEAVRGISEFCPERLTTTFSRDCYLLLVPNLRVLQTCCETLRGSSNLWFLWEQWQISASKISVKAFYQVVWEGTPLEANVSVWVLLPLFVTNKKSVQVHWDTGNNPCKWRGEEESGQSSEKLGEGREKAEIKKCIWAAKYLIMALQAQTMHLHAFFPLNFWYSWLLSPGKMLLWNDS